MGFREEDEQSRYYEYKDEWGNTQVLTAQRATEIMTLAETIAEEANALADIYQASNIAPHDILIDIQANPA